MIEGVFLNERIVYDGDTHPIFIDDIQNANQALLEAMKNLCGLGNTDFAIIYGFDEYAAGQGVSYYTPGICYMAGKFYYTTENTDSGKYLNPSIQEVQSKQHSTTSKYTYKLYKATSSNSPYNNMPVLSPTIGWMDQYRINLKLLKSDLSNKINDRTTTVVYPSLGLGFQTDQSNPIKYFKNSIGQVVIQGKIKKPTGQGTTAFTLPSGFTPTFTNYILAYSPDSAEGHYLINVDPNGNVSSSEWPTVYYSTLNIIIQL